MDYPDELDQSNESMDNQQMSRSLTGPLTDPLTDPTYKPEYVFNPNNLYAQKWIELMAQRQKGILDGLIELDLSKVITDWVQENLHQVPVDQISQLTQASLDYIRESYQNLVSLFWKPEDPPYELIESAKSFSEQSIFYELSNGLESRKGSLSKIVVIFHFEDESGERLITEFPHLTQLHLGPRHIYLEGSSPDLLDWVYNHSHTYCIESAFIV